MTVVFCVDAMPHEGFEGILAFADASPENSLFVANLNPRKMMSEISEGMLFDIGYAEDITPVLAVPEKSVPNGGRAG